MILVDCQGGDVIEVSAHFVFGFHGRVLCRVRFHDHYQRWIQYE